MAALAWGSPQGTAPPPKTPLLSILGGRFRLSP